VHIKHLTAILLLLSTLFFTCKDEPNNPKDNPPPPLPSCEGTMFGQPVDATNLDESICKPSCACLNFTSKNFTPAELESLQSWKLSTPLSSLLKNPYEEDVEEKSEAVCAIVIDDMAQKLYSLANFSDAAAAKAAGAFLTHHDECGLCSTLTDFTVYAKDRDIGTFVRNCGLQNALQPNIDSLVACLEGIGFTKPCAQIWAYNTKNTQKHCWDKCINLESYHNSDGTLGECLACDEEISGPVFKAVAGRTRRNTGLASSICRFCDEVKAVEHDYPF